MTLDDKLRKKKVAKKDQPRLDNKTGQKKRLTIKDIEKQIDEERRYRFNKPTLSVLTISYPSLKKSYKKALDSQTDGKRILRGPDFISQRIKNPLHYWTRRKIIFNSHEIIGYDNQGIYNRGEPIIVVLHGKGLVGPGDINERHSFSFKHVKLDELLESGINVYKPGEIENIDEDYAVVLPLESALESKTGSLNLDEALENDLLVARLGSVELVEGLFGLFDDKKHYFNHDYDRDMGRLPLCRFLFGNSYDGSIHTLERPMDSYTFLLEF